VTFQTLPRQCSSIIPSTFKLDSIGVMQALQPSAYGLPPSQSLVAITGDLCYVPLRYNGTVINSCVKINNSNQPVCWVRQQGWQVGY
jgi:hypothetical protein